MEDVISVQEQYKDGRYSDFVADAEKKQLYEHYMHYSLFNILTNHLRATESPKVLDLACGNGILSRKLRRIIPSATTVGVDMSPAMLAKAEELLRKEDYSSELSSYILSDVQDIKAIDKFDAVISGFFLGHIDSRDKLHNVMSVISNNLRPGGITINTIPVVDVQEGRAKRVCLEIEGSAPIILYDYFWEKQSYINAATSAGLVHATVELAEISPKGKELGIDYAYLTVWVLTAFKPK